MSTTDSERTYSKGTPSNMHEDLIAIVGIGCRLPGGISNPSDFWQFIASGDDAIGEVPADRWNASKFYDADLAAPGKTYAKSGGFLQDPVTHFDTMFFGISPREAASMDPQQRLMLEVTWEALEDGGQVVDQLAGSNVGVYVGAFTLDNKLTQMSPLNRDLIGTYTPFGFTMAMLSNRLSYTFDFRGPSVSIDTACSSSLVAFHLACEGLRRGECSLALAGGVNIMLRPEFSVGMSKGQFLAPDGRCKSFDARADGYGRGEGAGVVVLKHLAQALNDGDRIYAVVRGTGVNQDGRTNGISVPNPQAQETLIRQVCAKGDVDPRAIRYFEAHGTGTAVGDPIEAQALGAVVGKNRTPDTACVLGSVKANIGHLEAAAGIAGVIKAALCLTHAQIPPLANLEQPNPNIPFEKLGLRLPTRLEPMPAGEGPALVGVNSFGYGGTNAHAVMEEPPQAQSVIHATPYEEGFPAILPLSARSEASLHDLASAYAETLRDGEDALHDACNSAGARRAHHYHRLALVSASTEEAAKQLTTFVAEGKAERVFRDVVTDNPAPVFVFSGMGPQWWRMGRELLERSPSFLAKARDCDRVFRSISGWSILDEMLRDQESSKILETQIAQPANFVLQVSLAAMLRGMGIEPAAVVGHSVGEVAAAYVAGVLDLEQAVLVSYQRSRIQRKAAGAGGMLAAQIGEDEAHQLISDYRGKVSIAAANGPSSVTLSGEVEALGNIKVILDERGLFNKALNVEVAYHSHYMDPLQDELETKLRRLQTQPPKLALYSTVTGLRVEKATYDGAYWSKNIRMPVYFAKAMQSLMDDGHRVFFEIGPHPVLSVAIKECMRHANVEGRAIASLHRKKPEHVAVAEAIAALYTCGSPVNWRQLYQKGGAFVRLPAYPWQREPHWQESEESALDRLGHDGHVLLGRRLPSPLAAWENRINRTLLPYINDHCIEGMRVFPGTGYIELGLALHSELTEQPQCILEELQFDQVLVIDDGPDPVLCCSYDPSLQEYTVHSRSREDKSAWTLHARGRLSMSTLGVAPPVDLAAVRSRCLEHIDAVAHYQHMEAIGLEYGARFRSLIELWRSKSEVLARIDLESISADSDHAYRLHPVLLDGCLQAFICALETNDAYVPVGIRKIRFLAKPTSQLWCHGRLTRVYNDDVEGDISLTDDRGRVFAQLLGVRAHRLNAATRDESDRERVSLYDCEWLESDVLVSADEPGRYAIFLDQGGVGAALVEQLRREDGCEVVGIATGDSYQQDDDTRYRIRAGNREDLLRLTDTAGLRHCTGLVYCCALDVRDDGSDPVGESGLVDYLSFLQVMTADGTKQCPKLFLVTRGAQGVDVARPHAALEQAPLVGMARVARNEYPEIVHRSIDLDASSHDLTIELTQLAQEIRSNDTEDEVAYRGQQRYVQRMKVVPLTALQPVADEVEPTPLTPGNAFTLEPGKKGVLSELRFRETQRMDPGPREVEIEIHAAALNFKDVLKIMDMLPADAITGTYFGEGLGMEASGVIARVGAGVTEFTVGDSVVVNMPDSFRSYATVSVDAIYAVPKLSDMSHAESAGLPAVFVTAYYAMHHVARLKAGEKVLIHAAAGGVGLAAIQVAQWIGAEVFATAGSQRKRDFLRSLGIQHIMDSRSTEFADEVLSLTDGKGVDVVLNSIAGEAISKSLEVLSSFGRFVEIGKRDIVENNRLPMRAFNRNLSFAAVDIDRMMAERRDLYQQTLDETWEHFRAGDFVAIPVKTFPASQVVEAFQYLAKSKQIGKVVVAMREDATVMAMPVEKTPSLFRSTHTYLITGGLGGFGVEIAKWMVEHGAKHLALVGRRGDAEALAKRNVQMLEDAGATVRVMAADISAESDVQRVIHEIDTTMAPLGGVLHAAAVIDDGPLNQLDAARIRSVLRPKALGAWYLHRETLALPIEFFVLFSSVAGLVGSPGQGSYVAANTFLDALAQHRRSRGLPATSINWGAIADVGMVARHHELEQYLQGVGITPLAPARAVHALGLALAQNITQIGIGDIEWSKWSRSHPAAAASARYDALVEPTARGADGAPGSTALDELLMLAPEQRDEAIAELLVEQVAATLQSTPDKVDRRQSLTTLGVESLMAMELQAAIESSIGIKLSVLDLMKGSTIAQLAERLASKVAEQGADSERATTAPSPSAARASKEKQWDARTMDLDKSGDAAQVLARLDELSEHDVERLLNELGSEAQVGVGV